MKICYKSILFCLLFVSLFSCSRTHVEKTEIKLENWELLIGDNLNKVQAVPWESDIVDGGTGRKDYDGVGLYRIHFYIPLELKDESLAYIPMELMMQMKLF